MATTGAIVRTALAVVAAALAQAAGVPAGADSEAAAAAARAVAATLRLESADGHARFLGSATVWRDGRLGLTAAHVVAGHARVRASAAGTVREVAVRAIDTGRDLALLDLGGAFGPGLSPAPGPRPPLGAPVFAAGAPLGLPVTASGGIVSARFRQGEPQAPLLLLQHDAAINPGNSGGPLVDAAGRLVGMNLRIADGSRLFVGLAYALAADDLARLVPALEAGRLAPVPRLGLRLRPTSPAMAAALGAPAGLLVDHVHAGSLAARAGLRAGDVLLAAAGRPLARPGELALALEAGAAGGGGASLMIWRGGARLSLDLPAAAPEPQLPPRPAEGRSPVPLAASGLTLEGTRIAAVAPGSAAAAAGLVAGERIAALNGAPPRDLAALVLTAPALLRLEREGRSRHALLDPWDPRPGLARLPGGGGNRLDPDVVPF